MKYLAVFGIVLLCIALSEQVPKLVNCPNDVHIEDKHKDACVEIRCENGEVSHVIECPQIGCPKADKIKYVTGDSTKEYMDCCNFCVADD